MVSRTCILYLISGAWLHSRPLEASACVGPYASYPDKTRRICSSYHPAARASTSPELLWHYRRHQEPHCKTKETALGMLFRYKRQHCLDYQAVVMSDGIVTHVHGPIKGSHHDVWLYQHRGLFDIMTQHAYGTQGQPMYCTARWTATP